jgi:hypothetical protein
MHGKALPAARSSAQSLFEVASAEVAEKFLGACRIEGSQGAKGHTGYLTGKRAAKRSL